VTNQAGGGTGQAGKVTNPAGEGTNPAGGGTGQAGKVTDPAGEVKDPTGEGTDKAGGNDQKVQDSGRKEGIDDASLVLSPEVLKFITSVSSITYLGYGSTLIQDNAVAQGVWENILKGLGRKDAGMLVDLFIEAMQGGKVDPEHLKFVTEQINADVQVIEDGSGQIIFIGFEGIDEETQQQIIESFRNMGVGGLRIVIKMAGVLAFISSKGVIFINLGIDKELSLEEILKLLAQLILLNSKALKIIPFKNLPPEREYIYYLQYALLILLLLLGLRMATKNINWKLLYQGVPHKERNLKILIKAKTVDKTRIYSLPRSDRVRTSSSGRDSLRTIIGLGKDGLQIKELEQELDKNLGRMKYWANYLSDLQQKK
ncbi:MAG: hypothetical protein NC927_00540, partial [Candidatus Omnitrophica bacterium]|nr:hypothetical protein [Candidatus Omnitrophota bacterium]